MISEQWSTEAKSDSNNHITTISYLLHFLIIYNVINNFCTVEAI